MRSDKQIECVGGLALAEIEFGEQVLRLGRIRPQFQRAVFWALLTPLVVWWRRLVPLSAGRRYAKALPNAELQTVRACGHCVDMEKPDELARLVTNFLG